MAAQSDSRLKGINLLTAIETDGEKLIGKYQEAEIFSLPFGKVNNTGIYNRNEVEIDIPFEEFNEQNDVFCGIRLFIPGKPEIVPEGEDAVPEPTLAESIHNVIRKKSKLDENAGDLICSFPNLPLVVPRGKHTVDMYRDTEKSKGELRIHGSTYSYKIDFQNIAKAYLLPQNDDVDYLPYSENSQLRGSF